MKWLNINCGCKNGNNIDYGIRHNTAIFWKNSEWKNTNSVNSQNIPIQCEMKTMKSKREIST